MLGTRPDITFAVIQLSKFSANPLQHHLNHALYICKYLVGTSKYHLVLDEKSHKGLCTYTDSDWARNKNDYCSITGNLLKIAGGAVLWMTQTQKSVALSSTEAEYMAMASSARQVMWVKSLYKEISCNNEVILIYADN